MAELVYDLSLWGNGTISHAFTVIPNNTEHTRFQHLSDWWDVAFRKGIYWLSILIKCIAFSSKSLGKEFRHCPLLVPSINVSRGLLASSVAGQTLNYHRSLKLEFLEPIFCYIELIFLVSHARFNL